MAVELQHDGVAAVGQPIDAREVAIAVVAEVEARVRARGEVVDVHLHEGIVLTGLRVFVLEIRGIELVVHRDGVLLDAALVEAEIGDFAAVGGERGGLRHVEFLLIDPVREAVQDVVGVAVAGDAHHLARAQILVVEVAIAGEDHFRAVLGEFGEAEQMRRVGDRRKRLLFNVIDVIVSQRGAAIDALLVERQHNLLLVSGEGVVADAGDAETLLAGSRQIAVRQDDAGNFTVGEVVPFNAGAFDDGVVVAHRHGGIAGHSAGVEREVVPDVLHGDFLGLREAANR